TNLTPSMARLLADDSHRGLPTLRLALFVGEPLTVPLVDRLRLLAPSMTVVNLYGTTETQQALAHYVVPPDCDHQRPVPVGRGIGHTTLLVVRDDGRLAGIGERGEIWIASELLARGYLNDPELTAARFSDRPIWGGDRAYRTGDLGWYLPSGDVVVAGR